MSAGGETEVQTEGGICSEGYRGAAGRIEPKIQCPPPFPQNVSASLPKMPDIRR